MTIQRHAEAVRSYLDYLCHRPEITDADGWRDWVRRTRGGATGGPDWVLRTLAGPATVGLSIGILGSACTPEYGGTHGDSGGGPTGNGGTIATGGVSSSTGGVGNAGAGGISVLYGVPVGGSGGATGGTAAKSTGGAGVAGMGALYAIPSGGSSVATGGAKAIGGAGIAPLYGVPVGGVGGELYGIPPP
jgi:hypothetical protein